MLQAALKLSEPQQTEDAIRLERRGSDRHVIFGRVTAVQTGSNTTDHRNRICCLSLKDISQTGVGATVQDAIEPGTQIALFFPPHGAEKGFDLYGHVVRCDHRGHEHDLGICFDQKVAA